MPLSIDLVDEIAKNHFQHSRKTQWWQESNFKFSNAISQEFSQANPIINFRSIGKVSIKSIDFGAITSAHLFGLDELIIFSWYEVNSEKYKKTLDLGANIGLHSLLMNKFGFKVTAYEPDPHHVMLFEQTMQDNGASQYELRQKAIGTTSEKLSFTRVLGNTTGSHLTGAKANPYGELEVFEVNVDAFGDVVREDYDFVKMDVEGYEVKLISVLQSKDFETMDIMLEIGTPENASGIFAELNRLNIHAFAQKINWQEVEKLEDLPTSHREGSLFLTKSSMMNWEKTRVAYD